MDAWPIEETLFRPAATVAAALAGPSLVTWIVSRFFDERGPRSSALVLPRAALLATSFGLGATALGPSLSASRDSLVGHVFGLACALLAISSDALFARRAGLGRAAAPIELAMALGGAAALDVALWLGTGEAQVVVVSGALFALSVVAYGRDPGRRVRAGWLVGATLTLGLGCALALPALLTPITLDDAPTASGGAAYWRLRVDPWDERAMLAAAWAASHRGEPRRAHAQLAEARRMGVGEAPALELEAELAAVNGDCERARAIFDRALTARAQSAFEGDDLAEPLLLGGYHLPPTMVTECSGLEALEPSF